MLAKASNHGHVNSRKQIRALYLYHLLPQATKNQERRAYNLKQTEKNIERSKNMTTIQNLNLSQPQTEEKTTIFQQSASEDSLGLILKEFRCFKQEFAGDFGRVQQRIAIVENTMNGIINKVNELEKRNKTTSRGNSQRGRGRGGRVRGSQSSTRANNQELDEMEEEKEDNLTIESGIDFI